MMRLLRIHVIKADTCGGLLDGLDVWLRSPNVDSPVFEPLCLIGPNGSGKSQFLQVVAEAFQWVLHAAVSTEERMEGNQGLEFEVEYLIRPIDTETNVHVRVARKAEARRRPIVVVQKKVDSEWTDCDLSESTTLAYLPRKIVGYTSGDNETLSVPFLNSRSGYAQEVGRRALDEATVHLDVPDTRLMLIDYGTHLEVLVANLLLGSDDQRTDLLQESCLDDLHSFRCIIQLAHSAAPRVPSRRKTTSRRKGIQLTDELEGYLNKIQRCATCYKYDSQTETYTFDFFVDEQTRAASRHFWKTALDLYSVLHKLAMLNDLAISKTTRERFRKENIAHRFVSRLPEPQEEDKVFRFERVSFRARGSAGIVDYVSLSDGEHQLAQILGTFCMVSFPDVLFLLDEPESHFNPRWRVKFISRLMDLPTPDGVRRDDSDASRQDCLLTTHAPFVPSDIARDKVLIFGKDDESRKVLVRRPDIETYGTTFDAILEECFGVSPPISGESRKDIEQLMESEDAEEIRSGIERLGHSVEKVFLADRLRQLTKKDRT